MIRRKESDVIKLVNEIFQSEKAEITPVKINCLQEPLHNPENLKKGQSYEMLLVYIQRSKEYFYMFFDGDLHLLPPGVLDFSSLLLLKEMTVDGEMHKLIFLPDGKWKFVPENWLDAECFKVLHSDINANDEVWIGLSHKLFFGYVFDNGERVKAFNFISEAWVEQSELATLLPKLIELGDTVYYFDSHKFSINKGVIKYFT